MATTKRSERFVHPTTLTMAALPECSLEAAFQRLRSSTQSTSPCEVPDCELLTLEEVLATAPPEYSSALRALSACDAEAARYLQEDCPLWRGAVRHCMYSWLHHALPYVARVPAAWGLLRALVAASAPRGYDARYAYMWLRECRAQTAAAPRCWIFPAAPRTAPRNTLRVLAAALPPQQMLGLYDGGEVLLAALRADARSLFRDLCPVLVAIALEHRSLAPAVRRLFRDNADELAYELLTGTDVGQLPYFASAVAFAGTAITRIVMSYADLDALAAQAHTCAYTADVFSLLERSTRPSTRMLHMLRAAVLAQCRCLNAVTRITRGIGDSATIQGAVLFRHGLPLDGAPVKADTSELFAGLCDFEALATPPLEDALAEQLLGRTLTAPRTRCRVYGSDVCTLTQRTAPYVFFVEAHFALLQLLEGPHAPLLDSSLAADARAELLAWMKGPLRTPLAPGARPARLTEGLAAGAGALPCNICSAENARLAAANCGHMACLRCWRRMEEVLPAQGVLRCHVCRAAVHRLLGLFP